MNEPGEVVVGIDVAKAARDIAVRPSGEARHLATEAAGIAESVRWLQALQPRGKRGRSHRGLRGRARGGAGGRRASGRGGPSAPGARRGPAPPGARLRPIGWMRKP